MRRIVLWLATTLAALVLLFSYRTSTMGPGGTATAATPEPAGNRGAGGDVVPGPVVTTRWGDIQVAITVSGGRFTAVTVPVYPVGNSKDRIINARALPILNQAAVAAQSADIDSVSGATVTSEGYKQSLQAAIDAANLS